MFNPELMRVVCEKLSSETDPRKLQEMNALLQAVINDDVEESRLRLAFLAKRRGLSSIWIKGSAFLSFQPAGTKFRGHKQQERKVK